MSDSISDSADNLSERLRAWLQPISPEAPTGTTARHHPLYESVSLEVAKLESPAGDGVQWAQVIQNCGALLQQTTKDLWLAAYLAQGLFCTEGPRGAAEGATLLAELLERYWEGLFPEPKRLRSRGLAVGWYVERMGKLLPAEPPPQADRETTEALSSATRRLAELCRQRLAEHAPAFSEVRTRLDQWLGSLPKVTPASPAAAAAPEPAPPQDSQQEARPEPAATAEAPAAATAQAAAAQAPADMPPAAAQAPATAPAAQPAALPPPKPSALPPAPAAELTHAEAATDYLRSVGASLTAAASVLWRADPTRPLSYRLMRLGLWLHAEQPPPTGANGRTSVPPLSTSLRERLQKLASNGRWSEVLEEAESALPQHRFILDLQRFTHEALGNLGPPYAAARETVSREVAAMLRRLPGLPECLSADGSPLADEATRSWLSQFGTARPPLAAPAPSPPPLPLQLPPPPALTPLESESVEAEAQGHLAAGRVPQALMLLQARVAAAPSGRTRFAARLAVARACIQTGHLHTAMALYEALEAECQALHLEDWEPALASACLEGFITCSLSLRDESSRGQWPADLTSRYHRLARIDPARACLIRP